MHLAGVARTCYQLSLILNNLCVCVCVCVCACMRSCVCTCVHACMYECVFLCHVRTVCTTHCSSDHFNLNEPQLIMMARLRGRPTSPALQLTTYAHTSNIIVMLLNTQWVSLLPQVMVVQTMNWTQSLSYPRWTRCALTSSSLPWSAWRSTTTVKSYLTGQGFTRACFQVHNVLIQWNLSI